MNIISQSNRPNISILRFDVFIPLYSSFKCSTLVLLGAATCIRCASIRPYLTSPCIIACAILPAPIKPIFAWPESAI
ncbi:hypothetical protein DERP_008719 [Dermatophagoides pteronyssinus]|uniref:Uncharacterized protein n=1 Tax=Dermatophagoides pteronyssinus TaxID=6956 RepID=A0ABQ8IW34_DERPT|nr:hypothetical protein DERP_008719 [Dermatophagoides pteronyssinus]